MMMMMMMVMPTGMLVMGEGQCATDGCGGGDGVGSSDDVDYDNITSTVAVDRGIVDICGPPLPRVARPSEPQGSLGRLREGRGMANSFK
eukprot:5144434-Karenia_brevis.AAC.1